MLIIEKNELFNLLDNLEVSVTPEIMEKIAGYISASLKKSDKGSSAPERGLIIINDVASLMNEDKDELTNEDKVKTLLMIRSLQKEVLTAEFIRDPKESRGDDSVKGFAVGDRGDIETIIEEKNSFVDDVDKAGKLMEVSDIISDTPEELDCAKRIEEMILADENLKKRCGCRSHTFSEWAAEQIYKLSPEILDVINNKTDDCKIIDDMFSKWLTGLSEHDPVGYQHYLDDISDGVTEEIGKPSETSVLAIDLVGASSPKESIDEFVNNIIKDTNDPAEQDAAITVLESLIGSLKMKRGVTDTNKNHEAIVPKVLEANKRVVEKKKEGFDNNGKTSTPSTYRNEGVFGTLFGHTRDVLRPLGKYSH